MHGLCESTWGVVTHVQALARERLADLKKYTTATCVLHERGFVAHTLVLDPAVW